ncbi:MAG: LysM peptidoglycan-binding domain-containing protein [Syntrophotaleaceae bacterium]
MARIYLVALMLCLLAGCSFNEFRWPGQQSAPVADSETSADVQDVTPLSESEISELLADEADAGSCEENLEAEDADSEALDAETLEDLALLAGADQSAPEEEGVTVVEEAVTFDLPMVENAKVRHFVEYYSGPGRHGFRRWLERSGRYMPMMREIFAGQGLPLDLTYLAMIESGFNPRACSRANAVGPWQFMASTGKVYGLDNDWWRDERRDPLKATRAAARHLKDLHQRFDGDWYLAIAAYNAGPGKMERAIRKFGSRDFWQICHGSYLRKETKNYLPKLLAVLLIAKQPEKYGFTDLHYQAPLAFDIVKLPGSTDLEVIARLCDVPYKEIAALNPELKRWCTPPAVKNYPVRLPAGQTSAFTEKYAQIPADRRANYLRHRVRSGDTLSGMAKRYGIRSKEIVALNNIRNPRALRVGRDLILPLRPGSSLPADVLEDGYERTRQQQYRIRKGDSLWSIARRFGVSTSQLCAWNGIGKQAILKPGKVLRVAGSAKAGSDKRHKLVYRVRAGDTLWGISRRYDLHTRDVMRWNQLSSQDVLRPGDRLTLLVKPGQQG